MSPAVPPPPTENAKQALARHRQKVADTKRRDIEKALRQLRKSGEPISVAAVARHAGTTRKTVYKHPDLVATIDQYRAQPSRPTAEFPSTSTIVSALRRKLADRDAEIRTLRQTVADQKATIELLYGRIDEN